MIRRLIPAVLAVATLAPVAWSAVAEAHTPTLTVTCAGISHSGKDYQVGDVATLTVNGATQTAVVDQSGRFTLAATFTATGTNTWAATIDSRDNNFDMNQSGSTDGCTTTTTPETTWPTTTTTTPATPTTAASSTSSPPSTVTTSPTTAPPSSPTTTPPPSPTTSSTVPATPSSTPPSSSTPATSPSTSSTSPATTTSPSCDAGGDDPAGCWVLPETL